MGSTPISPSPAANEAGPSEEENDKPVPIDYFDGVLKYLTQMLMEEEDLEHRPCMFQESLALQAAEKSFYEVLGENYPPASPPPHAADACSRTCSSSSSSSSSQPNWVHNRSENHPLMEKSLCIDYALQLNFQRMNSSRNCFPDDFPNPFQYLDSSGKIQIVRRLREEDEKNPNNRRDISTKRLGAKKKQDHRDCDSEEEPITKHLASFPEDQPELSELHDKILLCPALNPDLHRACVLCPCGQASENGASNNRRPPSKGPRPGRPPRTKHGRDIKEVVDLTSLLIQCAETMSSYNISSTNELLKRIRKHSSPYGDGTERLAHYFANAIEARLSGTGTALYTAFTIRRISAADILKAYRVNYTACPFKRMSNIFANKSIGRLCSIKGAKRMGIIDFGILYGFQWPCIIQGLSLRPNGSPKLRITGIDFPQPGFRPAERVEETGRRLANYCERFGVPFEYNAIAKKWEDIQIEELKIDRDETTIVNCMYRLGNVPDETVIHDSPRNAVLKLIRRINPEMFVHGVINGSYNAPLFLTRFRAALFQFSALFDMYEATVPREDEEERLMFEREVFGRDVMNVIACEDTQRVERPETYKQWQVRKVRAGFMQMSLYEDIVKEVRTKVKSRYHNDFVVDEDGDWMLQGWKGRVMYALSCWRPVAAAHD